MGWERAALRYMLLAVVADVVLGTAVSITALTTIVGLDQVTVAAGVVTGLGFALAVAVMRGYELSALGDGPAEFQSVVQGGLLLAAGLMAAAYTTQVAVPRRLVFIAVPTAVLMSCLARYAQRRVLHHRRRRGVGTIRTLVVGDPTQVARLTEELSSSAYHGYQVVGACTPSLDVTLSPAEQHVEVLGAIADVPQVVVDHGVDAVVVAGSVLRGDALRRLSWALGKARAELLVAPDLVEVVGPRLSLKPTTTLSLLKVEVGASKRRMLAKATLDRVLGTALALVAMPLIAGAALAVRVTSPGKAFFRQTRVGIDGREFTMYKLRSMYVDADRRREELLASSDRDGPMFKMHADPRITPVGRFLRKYSLDELPQLFNIVKGDMSLVGPRPPLVSEVEQYHDAVHRRLHVRPGLTGLWQVSGRADLDWEESVRLDLRYVDNWSVMMDLMILWKTGRAVIGGAGAY
ncbi:sugar transferase [Actinotalea sp. C106]|uniref:sugar transferase n=1 Tax=Actinotalea sp. C106 TaxID=2908644 RepID=UPI002027B5D8|nr:sugar transferase [Actinotalea sp. C106]